MIPVFICEDDPKQMRRLKKIVEDYIMIEDLEMTLFTSASPDEILDYITKQEVRNGLYFLETNLSQGITGILLASRIRKQDDFGTIVFITNQPELMYLNFTYKIEAMDFIIKDRPVELAIRVRECIQLAHDRTLKVQNDKEKGYQHFYQVKVAGKIKLIPYDEIMFFETSLTPHMLVLHLVDSQLEFRGSIKEVSTNNAFFRCHKSAVVNLNQIDSINISTREIELVNGAVCPLSVKAMKELKLMKNSPLTSNSA